MPDTNLIAKTIGAVAEVTGTELSKMALTVMVRDLSRYPQEQVIGALHRCARECKYKLALADIIERLDDGRPGGEEAWSMMPRDEDSSVVWTDEMSAASGPAIILLREGDPVAARMAFREVYAAEVQRARDSGIPVKWTPSLGHDAAGREGPLLEAVRLGRLEMDHAQSLIPDLRIPDEIKKLAVGVAKKLTTGQTPTTVKQVENHLSNLKGALRSKG